MGIPHGVQSPSDRIVMQNVSYCINLIDHSIGSSVHKKRKRTFVTQAISEIPELSHGIQDRCPRHSKHPSLLAMPTVFSVTAKIEVSRKCAVLVVKGVVMVWEHQLDCLWREGLRPRALENLEGDSTQ